MNPSDVGRVLAITDSLGLHREAVRVPLAPAPEGRVGIREGRLVIELPPEETETWIASLRERLLALEGIGALRRAE